MQARLAPLWNELAQPHGPKSACHPANPKASAHFMGAQAQPYRHSTTYHLRQRQVRPQVVEGVVGLLGGLPKLSLRWGTSVGSKGCGRQVARYREGCPAGGRCP